MYHIYARETVDGYGNVYHTVLIVETETNKVVFAQDDYVSGYGQQYLYTAINQLVEMGLIEIAEHNLFRGDNYVAWQVMDEHGITASEAEYVKYRSNLSFVDNPLRNHNVSNV